MKRKQWILLAMSLGLIAGGAMVLVQAHSHQKLGPPGVTTSPISDSHRLRVNLPERVLDYTSEWLDADEVTLGTLPQDTSFGARRYAAPDGFQLLLNVVLMGADRTSLHKPQFCLEGQGYSIDGLLTKEDTVPISRPRSYELPIVRLVSTKRAGQDGGLQRGVYVYWYVADDAMSATVTGFERMWFMAKTLVATGKLQRWAYVSCFSVCLPGQEELAFGRIKQFIAAATPEFQTYAPLAPSAVASRK